MNQANKCIWLLGLSGAGKTTIANQLVENLKTENKPTILLDGDILRTGLNNNLGFSEEDRCENVRRTAEVAKLFLAEGYWVVVALITPLEKMRVLNRQILGNQYLEIYVNTPLSTCQIRDPKGLYAKVALKQIQHFTGIDSPFDIPQKADLVINTEELSVEVAVEKIVMCYTAELHGEPQRHTEEK